MSCVKKMLKRLPSIPRVEERLSDQTVDVYDWIACK